MLKLRDKHCRASYKVLVTDYEGNQEVFDSVKEAAKALDVREQSIRGAICYGLKLRGCTIEKQK